MTPRSPSGARSLALDRGSVLEVLHALAADDPDAELGIVAEDPRAHLSWLEFIDSDRDRY